MIIYLGADHRGFKLKETLKEFLLSVSGGYEVVDLGAVSYEEGDDYPDFAAAVAEKISAQLENKGILICGSGVGMDIVANKFTGVRSATALSIDQVYSARHDDDVNILTLAADFLDGDNIEKIVAIFVATPFAEEERYKRRLDKISKIESRN